MNPTIKKLEKRVTKLEAMLESIVETYNDAAHIHKGRKLDLQIEKAMKLLGKDPDTSDPCPMCGKPFKTCGHF